MGELRGRHAEMTCYVTNSMGHGAWSKYGLTLIHF